MRIRGSILATSVAFLASGAAALVYQVAWQRILVLHTGVAVHSVALIVAAFMAGLGAGSEIGGRWSARLGRAAALRAFAMVELGIALLGLVSPTLFYDVLYARLGWLYASPWAGAGLHLLALLGPTLLMGMSLPLLVRATVADAPSAARTVALLYGVNMAGAAIGAALTPWALVPALGVRGTLHAAPLANLFAASLALLAGARPEGSVEAGDARRQTADPRWPTAAWAALYAASGFCALALEIVWFRLIDVAVKSTAFTFGTVLAVYLAGCTAGTLAGVVTVHRLRRPLAAFLACQAGAIGWALLVPVVLGRIPETSGALRAVAAVLAEPRSFEAGARWQLADVLALYALAPLVLCGPATVLLGYAFAALHRAVQDDARTAGRKTGLLQAANIAGCTAGSLAIGLAALEALGTTGALRLLGVAGVLFALVGARACRSRPLAAAAAVLAALVVALPSQGRLWARVHALAADGFLVDEDASGVVALSPEPGRGWRMWVNGRSHSTLPFGGLHTTLGAAPAVAHPAPRRVAVVGLGSGDTAWAAGCRRGVTSEVTVFEICAPEARLLRAIAGRDPGLGRLASFLDDPRLRLRVADGRRALERGAPGWDVIEMDALPPSSPSSGNLYSLEFYAMCARRLAPGGIMCSWAPTPRVRETFRAAFPHVVEVAEGRVLLGSSSPIAIEPRRWRARLDAPDVTEYLGPLRAQRVWTHLSTARPAAGAALQASARGLNRDLDPLDEFGVGVPAGPLLSARAR